MVEYYARCMKCKTNVLIKDPIKTEMGGKSKARAVKGTCSKCGTNVFRILKKTEY